MTEADLAAPAEQHRQPDSHQRVDQDERQQEPVARRVEVRQLRPHEPHQDYAAGQPRTMVADERAPANRVRDTENR